MKKQTLFYIFFLIFFIYLLYLLEKTALFFLSFITSVYFFQISVSFNFIKLLFAINFIIIKLSVNAVIFIGSNILLTKVNQYEILDEYINHIKNHLKGYKDYLENVTEKTLNLSQMENFQECKTIYKAN